MARAPRPRGNRKILTAKEAEGAEDSGVNLHSEIGILDLRGMIPCKIELPTSEPPPHCLFLTN
jgi:hypothetical protein